MLVKYVYCPHCGAQLEVPDETCGAVCPECDTEFSIADRRDYSWWLIAVVVAACIAWLVAWHYIREPAADLVPDTTYDVEEIDPFDGVQITFTGKNGYGSGSVESRPGVWYSFSSHSLVNGDTVTVTAESYTYSLTRTKMEVVVSGLDEFVSDPARLSADQLSTIERVSRKTLQERLGRNYTSYEVKDSVVLGDRVVIYVLHEPKENILYDVYSVYWHTYHGDNFTAYMVCKYTNLVARDNPVSLDYETVWCEGDSISTTDRGYDFSYAKYDRYIPGYWTFDDAEIDLTVKQQKPMTVYTRMFQEEE